MTSVAPILTLAEPFDCKKARNNGNYNNISKISCQTGESKFKKSTTDLGRNRHYSERSL
jgi:hypothetical protein